MRARFYFFNVEPERRTIKNGGFLFFSLRKHSCVRARHRRLECRFPSVGAPHTHSGRSVARACVCVYGSRNMLISVFWCLIEKVDNRFLFIYSFGNVFPKPTNIARRRWSRPFIRNIAAAVFSSIIRLTSSDDQSFSTSADVIFFPRAYKREISSIGTYTHICVSRFIFAI